MAQFDVYENNNPGSKKTTPFLLDVQNDILRDLNTRVVVPLMVDIGAAKQLNPIFDINSCKVVMFTNQIAAISINNIGKKVCSLKDERESIIGALDFLITGY